MISNLPDNDLPHKVSQQEVIDSFRDDFEIEKFEESVFRGTLEFEPKALFAVLKKK